MFEILNRQLDTLFERLRQQPVFQWAVVTSVSPLQIRYDGQTDPVVGAPSRLVSGLAVGDRVWCQRIHRRDIILGKGQGVPRVSGIVTVNVTSSASGSATVTLPVGQFDGAPIVMLTKQSGGGAKYIPYAANRTATSFTVGVYSGDGSSGTQTVFVGWEAFQT